MPSYTFQIERFATPTGRMLVVNDEQGQLRFIDWEDHEERMQGLLTRYYRKAEIVLHEVTSKSAARQALEAYFAGELEAINGSVSYTHLRAHETVLDLVCRLLLEKKKNK